MTSSPLRYVKTSPTGQYLNDRIESSDLPFRRRERAVLTFRHMRNLQKFATMHASVHNRFSLDRQFSSRSVFNANRETATGLLLRDVDEARRI
ncbi:MAG: hypothetical protein ACRBM6_19655 [Geminicoccales bacterium]